LKIKIFSSLLDKSYFWFLSDMLFDIESGNIVSYTSLLEKSEWATHLILNIKTIKNLTQMRKTVVQIIKSDQIVQFDKITAELESQLLSQLMICCRKKDNWFRKPVLKLSLNEHQDIEVIFSDSFKKNLEDLKAKLLTNVKADYERRLTAWWYSWKLNDPESKLSQQSFFKTARDHCLFAIFPGLIDLKRMYLKLQMIFEELKSKEWLNASKNFPYFKHLKMLMKTSLKYNEIKKILRVTKENKDYRDQSSKLFMFSAFSIIVFILWLISLYSQAEQIKDMLFTKTYFTKQN